MKKKLFNDFLLLAALLTVSLILFLFISSTEKDGKYAVIYEGGKETARLPLEVDTTYVIGNDDKFNVLMIKDGKAFIKEASCPDKLCMHQGEIRLTDESLICLPNKVVISIEE